MMDIAPQSGGPIRVLLINPSSILPYGMTEALLKQNRIAVVGTACSKVDALLSLQACRPNVVVLHVEVGHICGIDLCRTIRRSHPNVGILFFTAKDGAHLLRSAIGAGAQGYLLKSASVEAILKSIEAVASGQGMIDPDLTHQVMTWIREGVRMMPQPSVASAVVEDSRLLSYVAAGKTNREIAQEFQVEHSVIATRLQSIYKRLRIFRRAEAGILA